MSTLTIESQAVEYIFTDYGLSQAEMRVAHLILKGLSNMQIATNLGLKESSIKFQVTRIYKRTRVKSRAEFLTRFAPPFQTLICKDEQDAINSLNQQLFISSTCSRTKSQIVAAWNASVAPSLSSKVSQLLLSQLLDALNLS